MDLKAEFGQKIKSLRMSRNLTQEYFAELTNMSAGAIRKIENGERFPAPENIVKLASSLGVEIKDLFDFKNHNLFNADSMLIASIEGLQDEDKEFFIKAIEVYKKTRV